MSQTLATQDQSAFIATPTVEVEQTELNGQTLTLPVLSEGYFWRLVPAAFETHSLQLRKKLGLFSIKVDERRVYPNDDTGRALNPITNIENKAAGMMRTRLIEREQDRIMNGLLGDFQKVK